MTLMIEVGTYEAKTRLSQLLERVRSGETVVITSRGKPIARLVPAEEAGGSKARAAAQRILARREHRPRAELDEILQWRGEGRR
jgi:prevent-host-death family protein